MDSDMGFRFSTEQTANKEKGIVPFSLFAVCTVENRKPISLCLEVKVIMVALYECSIG